MIKSVDFAKKNNICFLSDKPKKSNKTMGETRILPNNMKTRLEQGTQKTMSAFIDYPVKGFRGDINSNFYEFLTMGIVPYVLGSAMFIGLFNITKHLDAKGHKIAANLGRKMGLGVVFYGLLKSLSKHLVTKPVKFATGVDTELPYQNKVYNLPKGAGKDAEIEIQWQQRKVFDSKEFFRKDLLNREYYDNIAQKIGLGENLNDSISETTPIIQNIISTTNTAKSLSSYSWAAVGVALALQDSWTDFFTSASNRGKYQPKATEGFASKSIGKVKQFWSNTYNIIKQFIKTLPKASKQLWEGSPADKGIMKHSGKLLVGVTALLTAFLTANTIFRAKNMAKNLNSVTIDDSKESTVI